MNTHLLKFCRRNMYLYPFGWTPVPHISLFAKMKCILIIEIRNERISKRQIDQFKILFNYPADPWYRN